MIMCSSASKYASPTTHNTDATNVMLYHTSYSRFQALNIIRENAFQETAQEGESFATCTDTADRMFDFYQGRSNAVIAGALEDIHGYRPVINDF